MTERHSDIDDVSSVGWYRKHFMPDPCWQGKRVFIEFEGVFRDSVFWINGTYMDRHNSGYTSFLFEITDHLVFGEDNSIAVRVDTSQADRLSIRSGLKKWRRWQAYESVEENNYPGDALCRCV